jgi:hypothetical protein
VTVLISCFILFGAPTIAAGLSALALREPPSPLIEREPAAPQFAVTPQTSSRAAPDPFNPYPANKPGRVSSYLPHGGVNMCRHLYNILYR